MMYRFRGVLLRLVEAELESLGVAPARLGAAAKYVTGGFVELMTSWLDRPSSIDADLLAGAFRELTMGVLSSLR